MSCKYTYKGIEYTENELIAELQNDPEFNDIPANVFRSIATNNNKTTPVEDVVIVLAQRYKEAQNMIKAIQNSTDSKEEKIEKITKYNIIKEDTQNSIKEIQSLPSSKQLEFILQQAESDVKFVNSIYTSTSASFSDLQFASTIVDTWSNIKNALGIETTADITDEDLRKRINGIIGTYFELSEQTRRIAINLIKKTSNLSEKDITELIDVHFTTEWTRELGSSGSLIGGRVAFLIKEINIKINKEHNRNFSQIESQYEKIKNNPLFKQFGYDLFLKTQTNKKGNKTLALVTRYSQNFWEALEANNKILKTSLESANAENDKQKVAKAWDVYNKWNEKNTLTFNGLLFIDINKYSDQDRTNEINKFKALGFDEKSINNIIYKSQIAYEKFLEDKEFYKSRVQADALNNPSLVASDSSFEEYVDLKVNEFDDLHNPLKYYDQKFVGAEKITAKAASNYIYLIPVKIIDGKDSKYYDENFNKISSDPQLMDFYNWFTGFIEESLSWLPQEETSGLQSNFLPVISDRIAKEYAFTDIKESVNGLGDWFMNSLTAFDYEKNKKINPITRKEIKGFSSQFINENVAVEDRSKDLVYIAKLFSDMALVYKHRNTIKAEIATIDDLIANTKGSYKLDPKLNERVAVAKDATRLQSLVRFTVDRAFYGIKAEDTLLKSNRLFYDYKELLSLGLWKSNEAKKAKEYSDAIALLNTELENSELSDELRRQKEEEIVILKSQYYKLGGRKFSLTSVIDSSLSSTRATSLGFAPFSAARNLLVGKINNRVHAHGGRDFSLTNLIWANKVLTESSAKYWSAGKYETRNTKLIFGLLSDARLAEGEDGMFIKSLIDKNTTIDKFRNALPKAYTWLSSGDYHFKAEMLLAAMKTQKIKTADGKEISFWESLTEDREYDEQKYGKWNAEANGGLSFEDFYNKNMIKYKQLANKLHGASGKDANIQIKDNALGRLLILFKSWIPETVGVRFDPKYKDTLLDRYEEGYYRTFFNVLLEKKGKSLNLMFNALFNKNVDISDEMQLANFKKAVKELQIIVSLYIAYALLKSMAPDDDEDKKVYNLLVLRQLHDLRRDLTYYININSIGELQRDVLPIVRTYVNWGSALKAATYYTFGVTNDDGDLMYDEERTALKITKVLPVFSNINRVIYYQKQLD